METVTEISHDKSINRPEDALARRDRKNALRKNAAEQTKLRNQSLQQINSANWILSTAVKSPSGDMLGDIKDLVLDPESGQVVYVVICFAGALSLTSKLFAIRLQALHWIRGEKCYMLDIEKRLLAKAPSFDNAHWPNNLSHWDQQHEELREWRVQVINAISVFRKLSSDYAFRKSYRAYPYHTVV